VQKKVKWPYRKVCKELGLTYSSFMRWKDRRDKGQEILNKPGPDKVEPFDLGRLFDDILALSRGQKRTSGTGVLYEEYRNKISRRTLQELVNSIRREMRRERDMMMRRISWDTPRLIWSMDDTECVIKGRKVFLHTVQDLGSRYKFLPVTGETLMSGEDVAAHLECLFELFGAPLVLKRDNHGNLNNQWVDDVLNRHLVIPLNSPAHYPPYNGGVERAQAEIKDLLRLTMERTKDVQIAGELAAYELNLKERRSLNRHCSCELFLSGKQLIRKYHSRRRKEVYEEVLAMTVGSVKQSGLITQRAIDSAWRFSVETWLRKNGHITVSKNPKVLPYLS
jgi:transposase InsO family protein